MPINIGGGEGPLAFVVDVRCLRCEREQPVHWFGTDVDIRQVRVFAGLLDGSAFPLPARPGPESPLCKCGICGGELRATVKDARAES